MSRPSSERRRFEYCVSARKTTRAPQESIRWGKCPPSSSIFFCHGAANVGQDHEPNTTHDAGTRSASNVVVPNHVASKLSTVLDVV